MPASTTKLDPNFVWTARVDALIDALRPVLTRAHRDSGVPWPDIPLDWALSLEGLDMIARARRLRLWSVGVERWVDLAGIPSDLIAPLQRYLSDIPGYVPGRPAGQQPSTAPARIHWLTLDHGRPQLASRLLGG